MKKLLVLPVILLSLGLSANDKPALSPACGFIENKGQVMDQNGAPNSAVLFLLNLPGMNVSLKKNGFSYDTYYAPSLSQPGEKFCDGNDLPEKQRCDFHRMDIIFADADPHSKVVYDEMLPGYFNYYTAGTPANGSLGVRSYAKITYLGVYPGIDVEFIARPGTEKPFEYNFILHPGADASKIRLNYAGAISSRFSADQLEFTLAHVTLTEQIPQSYWADNHQPVRVHYRLLAQQAGFLGVGFSSPSPSGRKLVIDPNPALQWGTYYSPSGNGMPVMNGIADSVGVYLQGQTYSTTGIATTGAFQTTSGGSQDVTLLRFNANGTLAWCTYLGGEGSDNHGNVAFDHSHHLLVCGLTNSATGMSTPGAFQTVYGGGSDAFIARFDTSGQRLWCSYYGGNAFDAAYGISSDTSDNIYFSGHTYSAAGIATAGSYQPVYNNNGDGYVAAFTSAGARLWGTYFGGSQQEAVFCSAMGNGNQVVVTGKTTSSSGISTSGAYQVNPAGNGDGFVITFSLSGARIWGTYFGGSGTDYGYSLNVENDGDIDVTGTTTSTSGIASAGADQTVFGGDHDGFLFHFNSAGAGLWSTYIGGSAYEGGYTCASDASGNIVVAGPVSSPGLATANAFQSSYGGGNKDIYIAAYTPAGARQWFTYYGNTGDESPNVVCFSPDGILYLGGETSSATGIATAGAFQTSLNCTNDGMIARLDYCFLPSAPAATGAVICAGSTAALSGTGAGTLYWYTAPTGGAPIASGNSLTTPALFSTTTYYVADSTGCGISSRTAVTATVQPAITANAVATSGSTICTGQTFQLQCTNAGAGYQWLESGNPISGATAVTHSTTQPGSYSVIVSSGVCSDTSNVITTSYFTQPVVTITHNAPAVFCQQDSIVIHATPGFAGYLWSDGNTADSTFVTSNAYYLVTVTDANGCTNSDSVQLNAVPCSLVWPGNANNDTIVDNNDLLPIGLYFGQTGTPRSAVSNSWQGWPALDWAMTQTNGEDLKHADCNGDGTINNDDTLAIDQNYGLLDLVPLAPPFSPLSVLPDIYLVSSAGTYLAGDTVVIEAWIGTAANPATQVYGVANKISVSSTDAVPLDATFPQSFLGTPHADALTLSKLFPQRVDLAVTRNDHMDASGYGKIATLRFLTDSALAQPATVTFAFAEINAVTAAGTPVQFQPASVTVNIIPVVTGLQTTAPASPSLNLLPNPTDGEIRIVTGLKENETGLLEILDNYGQVVARFNATGQQSLYYAPPAAGLYTVRLSTARGVTVSRFVKL